MSDTITIRAVVPVQTVEEAERAALLADEEALIRYALALVSGENPDPPHGAME